jgi:hypothetical protein
MYAYVYQLERAGSKTHMVVSDVKTLIILTTEY